MRGTRIGRGTWPDRGGVVVGLHGVGRGRPQRAIYCAIVANRKLAHGDPIGRRPDRPPPRPGAPRIARANGGAYRVGGRRKGAEGNQECQCQESVRRFARDVWPCNARRVLGGVWRGRTRWARTQGTMIAKSIAEKQVHETRAAGLYGKRERKRWDGSGTNLVGETDQIWPGPGQPSMLLLLN